MYMRKIMIGFGRFTKLVFTSGRMTAVSLLVMITTLIICVCL